MVRGVANRKITPPSNGYSEVLTYRNTDTELAENPIFLQKSEIKTFFPITICKCCLCLFFKTICKPDTICTSQLRPSPKHIPLPSGLARSSKAISSPHGFSWLPTLPVMQFFILGQLQSILFLGIQGFSGLQHPYWQHIRPLDLTVPASWPHFTLVFLGCFTAERPAEASPSWQHPSTPPWHQIFTITRTPLDSIPLHSPCAAVGRADLVSNWFSVSCNSLLSRKAKPSS